MSDGRMGVSDVAEHRRKAWMAQVCFYAELLQLVIS
jgi:hypothetical protein